MRGYYLLRAVLVRWGAGEQKHGVGPGDWETEEMEAWEKGGRKGTSVAVAHISVCLFVCLFADSGSRRGVALLRVESALPRAAEHP